MYLSNQLLLWEHNVAEYTVIIQCLLRNNVLFSARQCISPSVSTQTQDNDSKHERPHNTDASIYTYSTFPISPLFRPLLCNMLIVETVQSFAAVLYRYEHVQVEAVVGFPEEEKQDEAEETRSDQTPVQPRHLCAVESEEKQQQAGDQVS